MHMRILTSTLLLTLSLSVYAEKAKSTRHVQSTKKHAKSSKVTTIKIKQVKATSHATSKNKATSKAKILAKKLTAAVKSTDFTSKPEVKKFISQMVKKHKFNRAKLTSLFRQVKYRQAVINSVNKPLEKETWGLYQRLFVSEWRIQHGVKFWKKYAKALKRAEKQYGVPASIIVATIGVETRYGHHTGDYRVMDSLSSLGFSESRRAPFFRRELEQFLLLTREQKVDPLSIRGSYAGAIGQPQFMPSSYRHYAVNFSKSGKIDLMNDEVDVIGSIANYYSKHGWKLNRPVAIEAKTLNKGLKAFFKRKDYSNYHRIRDLAKYGFSPKTKVKDKLEKVKVIELNNSKNTEYWLSYKNFDVIKRYNPSNLYAMAVYQLSHYITELRDLREHRQ